MEIARIPVNGGNIVVDKNCDGDEYKGVCICFEAENGAWIDIAYVESKPEDYDKLDLYCYRDVWSEDYTDKYSFDIAEMNEASKS